METIKPLIELLAESICNQLQPYLNTDVKTAASAYAAGCCLHKVLLQQLLK